MTIEVISPMRTITNVLARLLGFVSILFSHGNSFHPVPKKGCNLRSKRRTQASRYRCRAQYVKIHKLSQTDFRGCHEPIAAKAFVAAQCVHHVQKGRNQHAWKFGEICDGDIGDERPRWRGASA